MNTIQIGDHTTTPSKIVCIGRNYLEHIRELGNETPAAMVIFVKPNSAVTSTLQAESGEPLHYEAEICLLVQNGQYQAVGFGLDLTRRELQSQLKAKGLPWERAKAFDGAACFSHFVDLADHPIESLSLELEVNGEIRQAGGYELMMHKPADILAEIKTFMSLEDGDIVMTGTPKGVGPVNPGEIFTGRIKSNLTILLEHSWVAQ